MSRKQEEWRYEKYVNSMTDVLLHNKWLLKNEQQLRNFLFHTMGKAFTAGLESASSRESAVPVNDLTHLPEIWEIVKSRWEKGTCN